MVDSKSRDAGVLYWWRSEVDDSSGGDASVFYWWRDGVVDSRSGNVGKCVKRRR